MAYPSTSCISDSCAEYEDEARALLEGLSDAETYKEAQLYWKVGQACSIASKSQKALEQANRTIAAYEAYFDEFTLIEEKFDPETPEAVWEYRRIRQDLASRSACLRHGLDEVLGEFKEEQGVDENPDGVIIEHGELRVSSEDRGNEEPQTTNSNSREEESIQDAQDRSWAGLEQNRDYDEEDMVALPTNGV